MAELTEMPFGMLTRVGRISHACVPDLYGNRDISGDMPRAAAVALP